MRSIGGPWVGIEQIGIIGYLPIDADGPGSGRKEQRHCHWFFNLSVHFSVLNFSLVLNILHTCSLFRPVEKVWLEIEYLSWGPRGVIRAVLGKRLVFELNSMSEII